MNVPFHRVHDSGLERDYVQQAIAGGQLRGGGPFGVRCEQWLQSRLGAARALLTSSCTHALEMAALLLDIGPGDEVICPSFTFVSTANAFALRGATIVFVDIDSSTLTLDLASVEAAITQRTVAIVPVHYAGYCCDMTRLMQIAAAHGLWVVEDAAPAMLASWQGRQLGTIGHLGTFSFHETKNLTSGGEGGALLVNDARFVERAEVIREKGTDRERFRRGEVSRYHWQDLGSSYLMSELQAAFLLGQLERADKMQSARMTAWLHYQQALQPLATAEGLALPVPSVGGQHNAHAWFLQLADASRRDAMLEHCRAAGVIAASHYEPLHDSVAGKRLGRVVGTLPVTARAAAALVRLPLWSGMTEAQLQCVTACVQEFFNGGAS